MDHAPDLGRLRNELLAGFPDALQALLRQHLSHVALPQGAICFDAHDVVERVYFPVSGVISLVVSAGGGRLVEAGTIGREGAAGLQSAVWSRPSFASAIVQKPGEFWSISAEPLRQAIHLSEEVKSLVNSYTEVLWAEAQQLAACNAIHSASRRLARWLLQATDRDQSHQLRVTQEFLAKMLGVRRTSVTLLAQRLQNRAIIRYSRADIIILNRTALEATACQCHQLIRQLYRREPENSGVTRNTWMRLAGANYQHNCSRSTASPEQSSGR